MGTPDLRGANFEALLELAESKFRAWRRQELTPERDRRWDELKKQRLMFAGRAYYAMQITEELLNPEVRQRIRLYADVAHDSGNREMLSPQRLEEHRNRIMTSVECGCKTLRDNIERDARADGNVSPAQLQALLDETRYEQLRARVLDVVNDEIAVLEAEGNVAASSLAQATPTVTAENGVERPRSSRGRGRPATIPDARKSAALEKKRSGGTNRDAAKIIYVTPYPTQQQVRNVPSILRNFAQKSDPQPTRARRKTNKSRG